MVNGQIRNRTFATAEELHEATFFAGLRKAGVAEE
jgi:hypothetical protein